MDKRTLHRFMEKVNFNGENGCWIWTGAKNNSGAGLFVVKTGKSYSLAHRFMYEFKMHLKLDRGVFIRHLCGNILCVNPDHLEVRGKELRFWSNVDKRGEDDCWEWKGNIRRGYGRISIQGIGYIAHRYSYELHNGVKLSKGDLILHSCNNRLCVNPTHLRIGNHQDNMDDMVKADRAAKGSNNGVSKLSEEKVLEIKRLLDVEDMLKSEIAKMFGVDPCTITDISKGRTWGWLTRE